MLGNYSILNMLLTFPMSLIMLVMKETSVLILFSNLFL